MGHHKYKLIMPKAQTGVEISCTEEEKNDIFFLHLHLKKNIDCFPEMKFKITVPSSEVHYLWNPKIHLIKALNPDWFQGLKKTNGYTGAPVQCLIGSDNENRVCLAISDTLNTFVYSVVPVEETGEYSFEIDMFTEDSTKQGTYDVVLRLDMRTMPYYEILKETVRWWEQWEQNKPAKVPELAKQPMYSTWYSFHQNVEEEVLIEQCRMSAAYGCHCLLLDDGWQTEDNSRGYAYCGDWKNAPSKIKDMEQFVKRVHELGMKVIPWYSVPFIGVHSQNFARFQDMLIDPENDRGWHVLDPRYKEVREFIIGTYEQALDDWDIDGFKLDFVDEFVVTPFTGNEADKRRDFHSFAAAADCLMKDCIRRLKAKKPGILLEFRQTYNGPLMRSYGNIFRAVDCPFDDLENHVRVTDIRLLAGNSAVHSDMLMWHPEASAESAALQVIQIMFSVPQISMRLETLSREHQEMLRFYMGLWSQYRGALVNGTFEPLNPSCRYNIVKGCTEKQFACTYHSSEVISLEQEFSDMVFINGTGKEGLYLQYEGCEKVYNVRICDCRGRVTSENQMMLTKGLHTYPVPKSGAVFFREKIR